MTLAQLLEKLRQQYVAIQTVTISGESTESTTASPAPTPQTPEAGGPDATPAAPATAAPVTGKASGPIQVTVVLRRYKLKEVYGILDSIYQWSEDNNQQVQPLLLTAQETDLLKKFSGDAEPDTSVSPAMLFASYKKQEGYPANARRHFLAAFQEIHELTKTLEQEFPTTGLITLSLVHRIEVVMDSLLQWGAELLEKKFTTRQETWEVLRQEFSRLKYFNSPAARFLPHRMQSFVQRHQALATIAPHTYGDNDLEVEAILRPLRKMARALRHETHKRLTLPEERRKKTRRRVVFSTSTILIVAIAAFSVYWYLRPPSLSPTTLPKGAKTGGITGSYYKGKKFEKFITKRTDRGLNMYWSRSPVKGVPKDAFSVRWRGYIKAPTSGRYRFCLRYDDGAVMRLGTVNVVDDWHGGSARTKCRDLLLGEGWHRLNAKMYEVRGPAMIKLSWERPKRKGLHPIPAKNLCCKK